MGPPRASDVLRECLFMGADDAVLISDRKFAGADTLATSYVLSETIKHLANMILYLQADRQSTAIPLRLVRRLQRSSAFLK